jgi:hypothetical protein
MSVQSNPIHLSIYIGFLKLQQCFTIWCIGIMHMLFVADSYIHSLFLSILWVFIISYIVFHIICSCLLLINRNSIEFHILNFILCLVKLIFSFPEIIFRFLRTFTFTIMTSVEQFLFFLSNYRAFIYLSYYLMLVKHSKEFWAAVRTQFLPYYSQKVTSFTREYDVRLCSFDMKLVVFY